MIEAAECAVIGSGALGASIAFHLARGRKQVALVDKHALGSQTSPRAGIDEGLLLAACRLRYAHHYWQEMPAATR